MIIDLHVHTSEHSKCAVSPADEVMATAIRCGLDGLVITEHMLSWTNQDIDRLRNRFPQLHIFRGIEVSTLEGEDLLLYGLKDYSAFTTRRPTTNVMQQVRDAGGAAVLAHAFRYRDSVADALYHMPPDACEAWSHNIFDYQRPLIRAFSARTGCGLMAATDSHCAANIGAYAVRFDQHIRNENELAVALRERAYTPMQDRMRLADIDTLLGERAERARQGIAAGLDTAAIRQQIGGSLSFIDHIRAGRAPTMLDPDDAGSASSPGLQPVT